MSGCPLKPRARQFNNAGIACAFAEIDIGGRNGLISPSSARGRWCSRTFIYNGRIGLVSRFVYEYPNFVAANFSIVLADFVSNPKPRVRGRCFVPQ